MALVAIIFCIALQRLSNIGGWFKYSWFEWYLKQIQSTLHKLNHWVSVLVVVAPILIVLGLLQLLFHWHFLQIFKLFLAIIILLLCLDARKLQTKLDSYFSNLEKNDIPTATSAAIEFIGQVAPTNNQELPRSITKAIFFSPFEQIYSVLFWFIVFGAYGAAGYFAIALLRKLALKVDVNNEKIANAAAEIQNSLDWIPSRIVGFCYAIAGNFTKGFSYLRKNFWLSIDENKSFVIGSGMASLDINPEPSTADVNENKAAIDLTNRTMAIWMIAIILFFIGTWL